MITAVYDRLGADENMPVEFGLLTSAVENAQKKVEGRNFSTRKRVLEYDDVMNAQRENIYAQRKEVLDGKDIHEVVLNMINFTCETIVNSYISPEDESINKEGLLNEIRSTLSVDTVDSLQKDNIEPEEVLEEVKTKALEIYELKNQEIGKEELRELERIVMLRVVDEKWMNHIDSMDELKNGIGLRAYGQKDPVVQYRIEGFDMFEEMVDSIKIDVTKMLLHLRKQSEIQRQQAVRITGAALQALKSMENAMHAGTNKDEAAKVDRTVVNDEPKVGRNDACPCGSGKKYKNCCGRN